MRAISEGLVQAEVNRQAYEMERRIQDAEVKKVAQRAAGRYLVVKTNTEIDQQVSATHSIRSIPTLVLFLGGEEVARITGALPAEGMEEFVEKALAR